MLSSVVEDSQKSWFSYEPFTLRALYDSFQQQFITAYSDYEYIVKCYRKTTKREIYPLTKEYLNNHSEVAEQNVALLKNAIELWKTATKTTDAVAPILYHYSWHCFNSFFAYSFFRWEPEHSNSHGIKISKWSNDVGEIRIKFLKGDGGLLKRLLDAWTCLGASLAFSSHLPAIEENKIKFQQNKLYLLQDSNELEVSQLLSFDPVKDYERKYWKKYGREKLVHNPSFSNSMNIPTRILKSYLVLFVASSLARYRPILWSSTLLGKTKEQVDFTLATRNALLMYTQFGLNSISFLHRLKLLIKDIMQGKFELSHLP